MQPKYVFTDAKDDCWARRLMFPLRLLAGIILMPALRLSIRRPTQKMIELLVIVGGAEDEIWAEAEEEVVRQMRSHRLLVWLTVNLMWSSEEDLYALYRLAALQDLKHLLARR